jgi:protoporphyrin/coproporphyrin ferrochelatase
MNVDPRLSRSTNKAIGPLTPDHPEVRIGKVGVLLVNLGTPDAATAPALRRYLKQFLSDKRVIEWPRALWYPILYGIVLNTRPKKVAKAYAEIWNNDLDESYLRTYTRSQSDKLQVLLSDYKNVIVDWGMRYGQPSIESGIERLTKAGCDRIVMFPLYPHYAAATTATVNDDFFAALMKMRFMPAVRTVPSYHDEPVFIEALCISIEKHLATLDFEPDMIIASYHGIPQSYFKKGDPYHCHCLKTSRLLRDRMGWSKEFLMTTFQSRFGPEDWLQPYFDKTIETLPEKGIKKLVTFNPGFVSDCLETLEEIAVEGSEIFLHAGGTHYSHISCLNDSDEGMKVFEQLVRRELQGWV